MINIPFASSRRSPWEPSLQQLYMNVMDLHIPCGGTYAIFRCHDVRVSLLGYMYGQQFAEGLSPFYPIPHACCRDLLQLEPSSDRILLFQSRHVTGAAADFRLLIEHPLNEWRPPSPHNIVLSDMTGGVPLWPFQMVAFG